MNDKSGLTSLLEALTGQPAAANQPKPASRKEAMLLIDFEQLALGDIVVWRGQEMQTHTVPELQQQVIVTRLLQPPHEHGPIGEPASIALAYVHRCGRQGCESEGLVQEVLRDGRRFIKVGSILN